MPSTTKQNEDIQDNDDSDDNEPLVKAQALSNDDGAFGGQSIYSFKTPKRREALSRLAEEAVSSAKKKAKTPSRNTTKTPSQSSAKAKTPSAKATEARTPSSKTAKAKHTSPPLEEKKCARRDARKSTVHIRVVQEELRRKSDESSDDDEEDEESENEMISFSETTSETKTDKATSLRGALDEYFNTHHSKKKALTSDKTLAALKNPKMNRAELATYLKESQASHVKEISLLHEKHLSALDTWMLQLQCGFNVLLYGLGSKRDVIEAFRKKFLIDSSSAHLVVNGFFPSLTIKQILNTITDDLLEDETTFKTLVDQTIYIRDHYNNPSLPSSLYLFIHNIDGTMLRSRKCQAALSCIASAKHVHVVASLDHINAPLVWDQNCLSSFNWLWHDATTFAPYTEETSFENSLLVQQSGALALSSLAHVLRSLTPNARGIFRLLVDYQLENTDEPGYAGISFSALHARCREKFLVNSDLTLRAQLTEFRDHALVRSKKGSDGVEYLTVPLDGATLQQFLDDK